MTCIFKFFKLYTFQMCWKKNNKQKQSKLNNNLRPESKCTYLLALSAVQKFSKKSYKLSRLPAISALRCQKEAFFGSTDKLLLYSFCESNILYSYACLVNHRNVNQRILHIFSLRKFLLGYTIKPDDMINWRLSTRKKWIEFNKKIY